MEGVRLSQPDTFDFKCPKEWKRGFEQFKVASGVSDDSQVSTLLYCLGEEAENVLTSTHVTAQRTVEIQRCG